jgi:carbon monoxide dehydrogenase subunit G
VASCIPGATLSPDQGDGLWRGSIRVKFGPTVAVFRGEASLVFDDAARTCTIEGRGFARDDTAFECHILSRTPNARQKNSS